MKRQELEQYASEIETELDQLAYKIIKFGEKFEILKVFQSKCDFNLFWLYEVAPEVVLHLGSIKFLSENIGSFKRKLSTKEILEYDFLIANFEPRDFNEFKIMVKKMKNLQ